MLTMSDDLETQTLAALQAARETTGGRIQLKAYMSEKGQIADLVLQLHGDDFYPTLIDDTKVYLLQTLGELRDELQNGPAPAVYWDDPEGGHWVIEATEAFSVYTRLVEDILAKTTKYAAEGAKSSYAKVQNDPNLQRSPQGALLLRNIEVLTENVLTPAPPAKGTRAKAAPQTELPSFLREQFAKHIKAHWPLARYRFSYSVSPGKFDSIAPIHT